MPSLSARIVPCASSLLGALRGLLAALGDTRDAAEIAGLSGLAFRLQVDRTVSPASVAAFPWRAELPAALSRLGWEAALHAADDEDPAFGDAVTRAIAAARASIDAGRPCLLWGVHLAEFGLVRGYDDARGALLVSGVLDGRGGAAELPYGRVGRGDVPVLCLLAPAAPRPVTAAEATRAALLHGVRHGRGRGARYGGTDAGAGAYAAWRAALAAGTIDPAGHAYAALCAAELRAAAPLFLGRAAARLAATATPHLEAAAAAQRRAAAALAALAADWPFPLPDGAALATRARARHGELLAEAEAAEGDALAALERALDEDRRAGTVAGVTVVAAGPADAARLFGCVGDLPLGGLDAEAAELRARIAPALGGDGGLQARLAVTAAGEVVGHVYYAELGRAGIDIDAPPGRFLFVYCAWVARERRGAGLGGRLVAALRDDAAARGCDGVLVEATAQEIFLHHAGYEALGFVELDRAEDDRRLLYLPVSPLRVDARLRSPAEARSGGRLPVVVGHGRPCPLLHRAARNLAAAARACAAAGAPLALDERDGPPHGLEVGGRRLPLGYVPREAAELALADAARAWERP